MCGSLRKFSGQSLSAMATLELSCVVYAESVPALYFDKTVIQKLGSMGVALDIDLYIYNSR